MQVDAGLVFASDSRTNAGPDQVSTYSKMHTFGGPDRQVVLLSAGNLATTQGVVARLRREMDGPGPGLLSVGDLEAVAEHVGDVIREHQAKHGEAVSRAGFSAEASFIVGGQIAGAAPELYLVYPQGNYITTSEHTRYLQIGEAKYGKAILDRVIEAGTSLDDAARCALVSMDSTIRSNATVGPPIEILAYPTDSFSLDHYLLLAEDDPYLLELRRSWNEKVLAAFRKLPRIAWPAAQADGGAGGGGPGTGVEPAPVAEPSYTNDGPMDQAPLQPPPAPGDADPVAQQPGHSADGSPPDPIQAAADGNFNPA